jgi:glyoxylate/hydroxypyruvate reductase A
MARDIFLYKADPVRGAEWAAWFARKAPQLAFRLWPLEDDPARVRYLAAWEPPEDLARFPNLELVFSVGAGIDQFDTGRVPPHVPVVRMVEPGITDGMVEYVTLAVLAIHRDWLAYREQQREGAWHPLRVRTAASRRVGVLGLGVLGRAVLARLQAFGFPCAGWSASQHTIAGVDCHAGPAALPAFLARTDILVCLLPLTPATRGILDARLFAALPAGAAVINCGRGGHLVQDDLLAALDSRHLSSAVLDVCEPEPLPAGHPFRTHPRIMLTPHIASMTQPETAVDAVLENLRRHHAGETLHGAIERGRGY